MLSPDWCDKGVKHSLVMKGSKAHFRKAPVANTSCIESLTPVTLPLVPVGARAAISSIAEITPGSFGAAKLLRKGVTEELHRSSATRREVSVQILQRN